jgi:uncharacterized hydrophobic protein (TIGR00341 family)
MALRLIEAFIPEDGVDQLKELLKDYKLQGFWLEKSLEGEHVLAKILVPVEDTESFIDLLEKGFSFEKEFKIVLLPVEAIIPRPELEEERKRKAKERLTEEKPLEENLAVDVIQEKPVEEKEEEKKKEKKPQRISREELYVDISETVKLNWVYFSLVLISTILAAIGLMRGSIIVIIGAMVIAPLLGPNIALAFATTLVEWPLARKAAKANILGILASLVLSFLIGFIFKANPEMPGIALIRSVYLSDIVIAVASGFAGALAFTAGLSTSLVGVMVAVALLPPLVAAGLLFGGGHFAPGMIIFSLFLTNLIAINLSGVFIFLIQGISPNRWWEAEKAKRATRNAVIIWGILLIILAAVIYFTQYA